MKDHTFEELKATFGDELIGLLLRGYEEAAETCGDFAAKGRKMVAAMHRVNGLLQRIQRFYVPEKLVEEKPEVKPPASGQPKPLAQASKSTAQMRS